MVSAVFGGKQFGLDGPRDLVRKLEHDVDRFRPAESSEANVAFVAFDCAVTAWSIVDWVYNSANATTLKLLGIDGPKQRRIPLASLQILFNRVNGLELCYQLATGAKHFEVRSHSRDDVNSGIIRVRSRRQNPDTHEIIENRVHSAMIQTSEGSIFADEFFAEVSQAWRRFLDEEKIDAEEKISFDVFDAAVD